MKTKKYNGVKYNYYSTSEKKYLERIEKDGSVSYYKMVDRIQHISREILPSDNRQDFVYMWYHMPATD